MTLQRAAAARPSPHDIVGRRHALARAYPLAKQLAEILELEAIEPLATSAKHIRMAIGAELAELGAFDPTGDVARFLNVPDHMRAPEAPPPAPDEAQRLRTWPRRESGAER